MSRFKAWWRNENYDREYMRRFREQRHDWDDLPDEIVAQSLDFQWFSAGEAARDLWRELTKPFERFGFGRDDE